jgi:2-dehydropantoate 2-reductase
MHRLTFGDRRGGMPPRVKAVESAFAGANFITQASETILSDMWEKWVFIAATAGMTCLMRASIGDFVAAGGAELALRLIDECAAVAAGHGFPLSEAAGTRIRENLTSAGSPITASMLRDMQAGGRIESDQIIGDLLSRSDPAKASGFIMLKTVLAHLKAYEARRAREAPGG